ncbi:MAG: DNA polymerase III subunit alpha, partial [Lachnospiraceae bacterium]|nr:DNA polymerase III subunit alpha [Lachnospiraceae bacterium]
KKIKYTKNEKVMAFLQVEDLVGSVEVIVFPKDYERYGNSIVEDGKVFVRGRVSLEEDKGAKLVCEQITPFEQVPRKLWIKFPTKEAYEARKEEVFSLLREAEGRDSVVIYVENPRAKNQLPANWNVAANGALVESLEKACGEGNVKVV